MCVQHNCVNAVIILRRCLERKSHTKPIRDSSLHALSFRRTIYKINTHARQVKHNKQTGNRKQIERILTKKDNGVRLN